MVRKDVNIPIKRRVGSSSQFHSRGMRILKGVVFFCVVSLIIILIYYSTRTPSLQIREIKIVGGDSAIQKEIQSIINDTLDGSYIGLVPHTFAYWYPRNTLHNAIRALPLVREATVRVVEGPLLRVDVSERIPYAVWCSSVSSDECWFIDSDGYAFIEAPSMSGTLYMRFVRASSKPEYGTTFPYNQYLHDGVALRDKLREDYQFTVETVAFVDEYDVQYLIATNSVLHAKIGDSPELLSGRLAEIFGDKRYAYLARDGFTSIDMRFGNRIYIRDTRASVSNESLVASSTATTSEQY